MTVDPMYYHPKSGKSPPRVHADKTINGAITKQDIDSKSERRRRYAEIRLRTKLAIARAERSQEHSKMRAMNAAMESLTLKKAEEKGEGQDGQQDATDDVDMTEAAPTDEDHTVQKVKLSESQVHLLRRQREMARRFKKARDQLLKKVSFADENAGDLSQDQVSSSM